jgi:DNA invertase Pin-like site-specific DNA recombinase
VAEKTIRPACTAIGYLYVCMTNQNLEKNKADILQLADQHDLSRVRFAEEIASAKVFWQERKIPEALESIRPNEVIVVNELWRLGRSMLRCTRPCQSPSKSRLTCTLLRDPGA